ncbi:hypothetical protein [Kribbella albertanoniae]|uniref:Uncharacterized protein n=1 Tax=Kribbella albertanoniae TaxID=1266829 RepID=A0A4R4QFJ6_9ACTN|nr:hypothetical protein [Kribbella albertanoniae]TDC34308.1 hypothetical protein E1261_03915 [Kribbella albertanoniae]
MENDYADAPAGPVSRPAGPEGPAPDPGAGNQAFVETRLQAEAFRGKLMDERKVLQLDYDTHNAALQQLEELEAAGEITEKGIADRTALAARRDQLFKDLNVTNQDLLMLDDASMGLGPLNDMMVRRGTKAYVPQQNETTEGSTQLGPDGIVTKKPGWVETDITNGVSTTRSHSTTSTIDTSGWSTKTTDSSSTLTKAADGTLNASSNSKTSGLAIGPGGITGSWGEQSGSSATTAAGVTTSSSTSTSQTLGTGGYTKSTEVKDDKQTKKDTFGVTRGDGQIGMNASSSTTVAGKENKTTGGVGVLAGPDGVGGAGNLGKAFNQEKGAIKTGQTAGLDGKFVVSVAKAEGDPPRYQITMSINLGGKLGATGSSELEAKRNADHSTGVKASGGLSGSAAASVTATFVHVYSEEETKRYLGALSGEGGGAEKELQVIKLAADNKLDAAQSMLTGVQAAMSAEAASQLDDGGSASFELAGSAEGGANAGVTGGGFGATANVSGKLSTSLKRSVSRKGDKISITVSRTDSKGETLGGGASMGAASMGVSNTDTDKAAQSVTFELTRTDPAYAQLFAEIAARSSIAELRAYAQDHPSLVTADSSTTGHDGSTTTTAGVGPVSVGLTDNSGFEQTVSRDATGTTETNTGKGGGGITVGVAGLPSMGHSEKTSVSTTYGPKGASADLSKTTSDTDIDATATKYVDDFKKSPIASTVGLVTGAAKPAEEKTEVVGMKLADSDFDRIFGAAADPVGWGRPVASPRDRAGWMGLRSRIVAAGNDHKQIARLIAHYGDGNDNAPAYLASIVRGVGRTDGGAVYEWPGALSAEKASYKALVEDDAMLPVLSLESAGKNKDALDLVTTTSAKLDKLATDMLAKKNEFSEGAFGEMMVRLSERRRELAGRAYLINQRVKAGGPDAMPSSTETSDQSAADVAKATAKVAIDGHKQALAGFEAAQGAQFWIIQKELARRDDWFGKPSVIDMEGAFSNLRDKVYPPWRETLTKIREAARQAGLDENESAKPEPNKLYCNHLHREAFGNDMFKL